MRQQGNTQSYHAHSQPYCNDTAAIQDILHKISKALHNIFRQAEQIVLGKSHQIKLAQTCLLTRGQLLIEDIPGMGKITLAHILARLLGLQLKIKIPTSLFEVSRAFQS